MRQHRISIRRLAVLGLFTTLALILSYVEAVIPPLFPIVPGIKMGLANIVTIFLMYRFQLRHAIGVSMTRIFLSTLLFGSALSFAYSLAGGICSILVMSVLKRVRFFSSVGISVSGAVAHNLGQILMAMLLLATPHIGYYFVILIFTGTISGVFVGLCATFLITRIPRIGGEQI